MSVTILGLDPRYDHFHKECLNAESAWGCNYIRNARRQLHRMLLSKYIEDHDQTTLRTFDDTILQHYSIISLYQYTAKN